MNSRYCLLRPITTKRFLRNEEGAAAIEMAFALPLLLTLIFGIVSYGGWFFSAHNVQLAANEAARAAIGGITPVERAQIAKDSVETSLRRASTLDPERATVLVDDDGATFVVRVSYDDSNDPLLALKFLPMPSTTIERSAAVKLSAWQ